MTVHELKKNDPVAFDGLGRRGGWAARRSGPSATAVADAFGHTRQHGSRAVNGCPHSVFAKNLQTVYMLATGDETTAIALLTEEMGVLKREQIRPLTNPQLQALIEDLDRRILHADARKNVRAAETRASNTPAEDDEDAAMADMELADLVVYRGEAKRERAERKRRGRWL